MLDINLIRKKPHTVKENLKKKFQEDKIELIDVIIRHDKKWREFKQEAEKLRAERNKLTEKITKAKKANKDASKYLSKAKEIPRQIKEIEDKANRTKEKIDEALMDIPNIIHSSVPIGKDDSENVELEKIGEAKVPDFKIPHTAELAEKKEWVDFESSRKTSGHGFYYLKGDLARLHSALLTYARDFMINKGFEYIIPPFMIRQEIVNSVMSFEEKDAMMYKIENEDLYLIGTSEHSMVGMFKNKVFKQNKLPQALTSYSPCFRKEVGAHGLDEKGFFRVHQFEKQEMVVVCEPEESHKWYEKMVNLTVELMRSLEIPIRRIECCSGDLADLKSKSEDIEVWSPKQKKYFEIGSCSNMTDAQARRLKIRVENPKGENYYPHTLNNTVIPSPRILIAILENHLNKDLSINIPKALQQYMGGKTKIE